MPFDPFGAFDPIDPVPAAEPAPGADADDPPDPDRRSTRRWTKTASRRVQPSTASSRPVTEQQPPSRSDASGSPPLHGGTGPSHARGAACFADLDAFGASALSDLHAAVAHLRAHGHVAGLTNRLHEDPSTIAVHFRPHRGALAAPSEEASEPARFEVRVTSIAGDDARIVVGYAPGSVGAPFTFMAQGYVDQLDRTWVARRFNEFVQGVLELV